MSTTTMDVETANMATAKEGATKYVYFFGEGKADGNGKMKDVLGGKSVLPSFVFKTTFLIQKM